ncbi:hypothetical protein [Thalassospira marina]|uniref:hypothetical protein n=1 Tax=Thalassospira marina TaxID=2048283 RepID=UPI0012FF3DF5|nr:hypothetical protein [Thalassospira marina]
MKKVLTSFAYALLGYSYLSGSFHINTGSQELLVALAYLIIAMTYLPRFPSSEERKS